MTPGEIRVGDVGTALIFEVTDKGQVVDLSSFTTLEIVLKRPSGKATTHTATFVTDGTDGDIQYLTLANDLNEHGKWEGQAYVAGPSGQWHSTIIEFHVHQNL